ncbi:MAG: hypothetical protein DELT_00538 [Desulfovibrio sp.]
MKKVLATSVFCFMLLFASTAMAHSPMCSCFDNGDNTITCEGGFSDGSSAAGVKILVLDGGGKTLLEGKMNKDSEYTFNKPKEAYKVVFDAGDGHKVEIDGSKIVE